MWRKGVSIVLVVVLVLGSPGWGWADVNQSLQDMFTNWGLVNVTPAGAYESQQRGYFTGGRLSVRTYNDSFSLFNFAAPQFSVGCSGIDVYLGAFSYGKLSRYVDLLTQLGTGVVLGFAFQLAMKELCESCADVLARLESAARNLNALGRMNPCEVAKRVGDDLANGNFNTVNAVMKRFETAWEDVKEAGGAIADIFEGRDVRKTQTRADAMSDLSADPTEDPRGNLVWMVLKESGADDDLSRMIMSALGTIVVDDEGEVNQYPPILRFEDLFDGRSGDQIRVYQCADGVGQFQCLSVIEETVTNLEGFKIRIFDRMVAIHNKIRSGTALDPSEEQFVQQVPVPVYRMLADTTGSSPERGLDLIQKSSALIAAQMTKRWLEWAAYYTLARINHLKDLRKNYVVDVTEWRAQARTLLAEASRKVLKEAELVQSYWIPVQQVRLESQSQPRQRGDKEGNR